MKYSVSGEYITPTGEPSLFSDAPPATQAEWFDYFDHMRLVSPEYFLSLLQSARDGHALTGTHWIDGRAEHISTGPHLLLYDKYRGMP